LISITVTTVKAGRSFNIMMRIHKELQVWDQKWPPSFCRGLLSSRA
jgi:hypothetical protein